MPPNYRIYLVFYVSLLKPYVAQDGMIPLDEADINEEPKYKVKRIVDDRV